MRRSDGTRRRRPPRSVSPGRWGACGGRPHGRVDGDRVSRVMGGVLRSTREEGARLRVPPRGRGAGDDQWCSPPSSCASPLPPLGESAVVDEVVLLVVIPPSPRFALPGLDAGVVGQSVTRVPPRFAPPGLDAGVVGQSVTRVPPRFAPPGRHGPGAEAGGATPVGACRGPAAAVRAGPAPAPTASHCGPRHRSPNSNRSRASLRAGASREPPPRQETHPGAPQSARSPGNPRARHLTHEIVT